MTWNWTCIQTLISPKDQIQRETKKKTKKSLFFWKRKLINQFSESIGVNLASNCQQGHYQEDDEVKFRNQNQSKQNWALNYPLLVLFFFLASNLDDLIFWGLKVGMKLKREP
jgi:hypothetical protein